MKKNKYDITALALMYYPDSSTKNARRRFVKTLRSERLLWRQLAEMNFTKFQRVLTPKQYEAIVGVLGTPDITDDGFGHWPGA